MIKNRYFHTLTLGNGLKWVLRVGFRHGRDILPFCQHRLSFLPRKDSNKREAISSLVLI